MRHARRTPLMTIVLALGVLAFGLGLSSCGRPSDSDRGAIAPPARGNDINPLDHDRLADGGTFTVPIDQMPATFNNHHLDGTDVTTQIMGALLPSVFSFDASAQPILRKEYVTSAELTATAPKQVLTYRINPKASWYDGTPITVADFEAEWQALNGTNRAYEVASTEGYDKIERVAQGADEREVVVTFSQPYTDWQALFNGLHSASTTRDPAVFNEGWHAQPLTTAGPFRLEGVDPTAQTITLVRNERWWGQPAKLDRIVFRVIDPDAQVDALANGEVDVAEVGADANKLRRAQRLGGVALRRAAGPDFTHITFNGVSDVLTDVRVRRALALAIDRQTIVKAQLGPLGLPTTPLGNHIFMTTQKGYQDNAGNLGRHDPQQAEALLDEAGWARTGSEVRTKAGKPLTLRFVIPSEVTGRRQIAELVQGMLGNVGARVVIETVPPKDFFVRHITPGNFDLTTFAWSGKPFPISSAAPTYVQPKVDPGAELDDQQSNYGRIGSDEIDRLFDQATAEFDREAAVALANQIDAKIWTEVHSLTLYQLPEIVAAKETLANFGAFGFATPIYEDVGFTKR